MAGSGKIQFVDLEKIGPGTPAGKYLRLFWQPVMRARDLPPGRAKPLEILGEKFTIYRADDGTARVVSFRCPHRGTPLSLGWVEGDTLRCRYHGWKFDGTGQCVEQPNEDRPFCDKVRMPVHPTREYCGLIFAHLGEGAVPPFRHYPDFDLPGVTVADPPEVLPCTFWNKLDNDHSHVPWVHRATAIRKGRNDYLVLRKETVEETPYGYISWRKVEGEPVDFKDTAYFFMPNARQFWTPTRAKGFEGRMDLGDTKMTWTLPVNDSTFVSFDVTHTPLQGAEARRYEKVRLEQQEAEAETRWDLGEKILAGEMTPEDLPDELSAYTSFSIEDYVTQVGQGPIAGRSKEHLSSTDVKVVLLRRLWLREVNALVEGGPLTEWNIPTEPFTASMARA
jgi:5,5'-dehydrodivanillate O-demethylase